MSVPVPYYTPIRPMLPVVEYPHLRGQPFSVSEKEKDERRVWPNCVTFYFRLQSGVYHLSHGTCGENTREMRERVADRIEAYAKDTELGWSDTLNHLFDLYSSEDDQFKGQGLRLADAETNGGKFYVTMQDKTDAQI